MSKKMNDKIYFLLFFIVIALPFVAITVFLIERDMEIREKAEVKKCLIHAMKGRPMKGDMTLIYPSEADLGDDGTIRVDLMEKPMTGMWEATFLYGEDTIKCEAKSRDLLEDLIDKIAPVILNNA